MMKSKFALFVGLFCLILVSSCEKEMPEDPVIPNEEEVITTLIYTLIPDGGMDTIVFSFQDLDGENGNPPVVQEGILSANTEYSGTLQLLNETVNPVDDITLEVEEEGQEHQFFFLDTDGDMDVIYTDMDADGNPIGITSTLTTNDATIATLTIVLKHEPEKTAAGVQDGDITNAGGETDIEVTFNVAIE